MKLNSARTITATIIAGALVAFGATACGSKADGQAATPNASEPQVAVNAGEVVRGAVEKTKTESYHMTMSPDLLTMEASVDPVAEVASMSVSMSAEGVEMDIDMRVIGEDMYMKFTGGPLAETAGDKWYLTSSEETGELFGQDQMDPSAILDEAKDVVQVDANTYTGTIEVSAADMEMFGGSGKDLDAVPFTLKLDDQGRISRVDVTYAGLGPDGEDVAMVVEMDGYGEPVTVEAPPADEVEEGGFGGI